MTRENVWHGDRGEGSVFYRLKDGKRVSPNLYISYRADGREQVVTAKTDDLDKAKKTLRDLTRNAVNARQGLDVLKTPKAERVTVGDLLDSMLESARSKQLASLRQVEYRTETLRAALGGVKAIAFGPAHVTAYTKARRGKVSDTSIRKELEILDHAFKLAVRRGQLRAAPWIEKPTEDRVKTEALSLGQWRDVLAELGRLDSDARDFCEFGLLTCRRPSTIQAIRWSDYDRDSGEVFMPSSKDGKPARYPMTGLLADVFKRRVAARRPGCDFVFHRNGKPFDARGEQLRKLFKKALGNLGIPYGRDGGFTPYIYKHSGLSAAAEAGIEREAVKDLSGHKTDSAFQRYVIENTDNRRKTLARRDAAIREKLADKDSDADILPIRR